MLYLSLEIRNTIELLRFVFEQKPDYLLIKNILLRLIFFAADFWSLTKKHANVIPTFQTSSHHKSLELKHNSVYKGPVFMMYVLLLDGLFKNKIGAWKIPWLKVFFLK